MAFIFQAKPSTYDLKMKLVPGRTVNWAAGRYQRQMKKGDIVYLWRAGPPDERGLYGWGLISSDGAFLDSQNQYRVSVTYEYAFHTEQSRHLSFFLLESNPVLQDMLIRRNPVGSIFLLSDDEDREIRRLIAREYGQQSVPPPDGRRFA